MINKQSLWFLTLFSLILVLSVYYITMPNELLLSNNNYYGNSSEEEKVEETLKVTTEESELLTAMRVSLEESRAAKKANLESLLTNNSATSEEKNEAFEELKYLNFLTGEEQALELKIKSELNINCFVKRDGTQISVVAISDKHDNVMANKIMRIIQSNYDEKMYISVKFEK